MVPLVLVVDDQPQLVRALRINLRARQYEVLTAGTGREALAVAAASPPDAMILDLGLPDVDGTEVIVAFRDWSRAPIIVLSGRTSPGDKIGALDAGADDYVTKPFAMGELLAKLRAARRRGGRPAQPAGGHGGPVGDRSGRAYGSKIKIRCPNGLGRLPCPAADSDGVADPGDPAAPPGTAGQLGPAADRRVGSWLP